MALIKVRSVYFEPGQKPRDSVDVWLNSDMIVSISQHHKFPEVTVIIGLSYSAAQPLYARVQVDDLAELVNRRGSSRLDTAAATKSERGGR